MRAAAAASSALLFVGTAAAQQRGPGFEEDFDRVEIRTEHVAGQVHMLAGAGGNIGVFVGQDGVFLVDDQFAPLAERIITAIQGISERPIRFVINTHFHEDHTGGNEIFGAMGTLIIAHQNVRRTLSAPHYIETVQTEFPAFETIALPVITFAEGVKLHLNGEQVDVFHAPAAHTDGDSIVYFRGSNVVHMGDILRVRGPIIDTDNGGTYYGTIKALQDVLAVTNQQTIFIPGHGGVATHAGVAEALQALLTVRDRIANGIAEGMSREEVIAARPADDMNWSAPRLLTLDRIVERIYLELSRQGATAP
jgi:glyoxylase-like metal-dependent hydrolase (beta-lactamase superfamily II)